MALAGVTGAADARPRKKPRKVLRGHVTAKRAGLASPVFFGGLPGTGSPVPPQPPAAPGPAPGTDPQPPPPPPLPAGSGRAVQARTDDSTPSQLRLILSRASVLPGDVKVEFNNAFADDPHDLLAERVDGTGASYAFDELGPGEVQSRTPGARRREMAAALHDPDARRARDDGHADGRRVVRRPARLACDAARRTRFAERMLPA